jgi:hypothetical protein
VAGCNVFGHRVRFAICSNNRTPLPHAAENGNIEVVELLLVIEPTVDINLRALGTSPLSCAVGHDSWSHESYDMFKGINGMRREKTVRLLLNHANRDSIKFALDRINVQLPRNPRREDWFIFIKQLLHACLNGERLPIENFKDFLSKRPQDPSMENE